ncbi:hypothetical protein E5D57_005655 [Metarhizium anisopliae]|nr:hypothetical protein E5D57_005655 [Metarhizium anisopliae]
MKAVQSGAGRVPSIRLRCSSCATCRQRPPTRCAKERHNGDSGPGARQQPGPGPVVSGDYDARKPSSTSNEAGLEIVATQIAGKAAQATRGERLGDLGVWKAGKPYFWYGVMVNKDQAESQTKEQAKAQVLFKFPRSKLGKGK